MSTAPTLEYGSADSADFWAWMGPKVDAWDAEADLIASMPERKDDEAMCLYGEDIEFLDLEVIEAPVSQAPDLMAQLAIW